MKAHGSAGYERLEKFIADPPKALWTLSVPIIVGMSIQTLYMVVDMIFVGRAGADALTALSFNLPLLFLAMGATFGLGSGITALIAQAIGAKDQDRADGVAEHTVAIGILMTLFFTVIGLLYGRPILRLLGVPPELLTLSWDYFKVTAAGYVFMVMAVFFRSILSGEGEVKIPVMIQAAGTLLNIALDPLFIFTLGLGVQGAAAATVVSQALVASCLFYLLFIRKQTHVQINMGRFRWSKPIVAGIFRIGVPASLSFFIMGVGSAFFNRILVDFSPDAVAAHQVGGRLDHVVVLPIVAISHALVTLVGMFYGAQRFDLVRSIVRYSIVRGMAIGVTISAIFYIFAPQLAAVFTADEGIRALSVQYIRTISFAYPLFPLSMITGRCLQGLGHGSPELILTLLRVLVIAVPLAYTFLYLLDKPVQYTWVAIVLASWTSAAIASLWLRVGLNRSLGSEAANTQS